MQQRREEHWHAALRVMHYLKGQLSHGVLFKKGKGPLSLWLVLLRLLTTQFLYQFSFL